MNLVSQDLSEGQPASVLAAHSRLVHNLQTRRRLSEPVLNAALSGFIVQYIALLSIQMWLMQAAASYCNTERKASAVSRADVQYRTMR